ncbi:inositol monophosphatase [Campylobacterota bacterium]|nr:inositol monophosphatase [Campylobacterota bacterium]
MSDFINAAIEANEEIVRLLRANSDGSIFSYADSGESGIGFGGDRSLKIDLIAEEIFIKKLGAFGRINSEECGPVGSGDDEIVIDPIDGSANIASGIPYYGSSVSLKSGGKAVKSIVCNMANDEYFVRDQDEFFRGALFDKTRFKIARQLRSQAGIFEKSYLRRSEAELLVKNGFKFRSPGALALSLAYSHNARFVVSMGRHREYDIIAGLHLSGDLYSFVSAELIIISADQAVFERLNALLREGGI